MNYKKFDYFPLGAVCPSGYLKSQLLLQAEHITGDMELYEEFSEKSGWLGGDGESWERGPYYVRGLIALAYTLKDNGLIKKAKKWIDFTVDNQKDSGDFGSTEMLKTDITQKEKTTVADQWWARMPMLMAIRNYYEAELFAGSDDSRILPFFEKYFRFQAKWITKYPLDSWAKARGADNIEVILWYKSVCEKKGIDTSWLDSLAELILSQTFDWSKSFCETYTREHIVNTTQGFRFPYYQYLVTGDKSSLEALQCGIERIGNDHGRIDFLPNADEAAKDNRAVNGAETCAVVEGMLSFELAGAISGDSRMFDLLESYAYNNLPNCFDYDITAYNYFQVENCVMMTHGSHGFYNDHGDSNALGIGGFECCFSNLHMGYPKFVQSMWAYEKDTVILTAYGENRLEADFCGKRIVFDEKTGYPYRDKVMLTYFGENAELSLKLRIPSWTRTFAVKINGNIYKCSEEDGYAKIKRSFCKDDLIEIQFESVPEICDFHNNSMFVKKGAVIYCMPIREDWRQITDFSFRGVKYDAQGHSKNYEIYPKEKWNYTFYKNADLTYYENEKYDNTERNIPKNVPCGFFIDMHEAKNWKLNGNNVDTVLCANVADETIKKELIPTAFSRLKISVFPKISLVPYSKNQNNADVLDYICKNIENAATVPTTLFTAYQTAQLSFEQKKNAGYYYYIIYGTKSGEYTDISGKLLSNPYSYSGDEYGGRIERDKQAVTLGEASEYYLRVACMKDEKLFEISQEVKYTAEV